MPTATMNISLPEELKDYVRERVAEESYSNPSDYVRALIREDQKRQAEQKLEALLLEGLRSGEATDVTAEDWAKIRREVRSRIEARRHKRGA
jgi:antitoxin ParD1/3/4